MDGYTLAALLLAAVAAVAAAAEFGWPVLSGMRGEALAVRATAATRAKQVEAATTPALVVAPPGGLRDPGRCAAEEDADRAAAARARADGAHFMAAEIAAAERAAAGGAVEAASRGRVRISRAPSVAAMIADREDPAPALGTAEQHDRAAAGYARARAPGGRAARSRVAQRRVLFRDA
jgi:hypothetical protein